MVKTVLLITHESRIGGGEINLLALASGLDRKKYHPVIVTGGPGPLADMAKKKGLDLEYVSLKRMTRPLTTGLLNAITNAIKLHRLARKYNAVILHSNTTRASASAAIAGVFGRRRIVFDERNLLEKGMVDIDARIMFLADAVICHARAVAQRFGTSKKVKIIPNGVDFHRFKPSKPDRNLKNRLKIDDAAAVAGIVGRITPGKGQDDFIKAAETVSRAMPSARFIIVGTAVSGTEQAFYRQLKDDVNAAGLRDAVRFTGFTDDVVAYYNIMDVVVLPSVIDSFGTVCIEAAACEKPVIAYDHGGVPEVVEHSRTGMIVPPGDVKTMADELLRLMNDPLRIRKMGKLARQKVINRYSIDSIVKQVTAVYDEVTGGDD